MKFLAKVSTQLTCRWIRLSELTDVIPLMVSERLVDVSEDYQGRLVEVSGQFRSYNRHEGAKNKLVLSIFVREWEEVEENLESGKTNQIFLDGYICKAPIYRKTPLGREIADLLVAVNRTLWQVRLHTLYCMGTKCKICINF